jgi:hypothetical protein
MKTKTFKKENEEDTRILENLSWSWISRINIVKMAYYPKQSTDSTQLHSNPKVTLHGNRKKHFKIHMEK